MVAFKTEQVQFSQAESDWKNVPSSPKLSALAKPAGPGRAERNKLDKLNRIKRAARTLFGRLGFERTTIRQIAEAADVGTGTVFLYAEKKEDLLVLIFREEVGRAVERAFATMPSRPLLEQILHVFDAMIAHHERNQGLARVFVKELPFVDDSRHGVAELMVGLLGGIEALIEAAKSRGEIRAGVPAKTLARNCFALYIAELQRWLGSDPITSARRDEALRAALELQLDGLGAERAPAN